MNPRRLATGEGERMGTTRKSREADLILGAFPRPEPAAETDAGSPSIAEVIDFIPFLMARLAQRSSPQPTDLA